MGTSRAPSTYFPGRITRRDLVNGMAACATLSFAGGSFGKQNPGPLEPGPDWYGYGGIGDYRHSHGNSPNVVVDAHRLRDGGFPSRFEHLKHTENADLVIVGGGMAGLGAALEFSKTKPPGAKCILLDNHPILGGEAKENEFFVDGERLIAPQGANGFFVPPAVDDPATVDGDPRYYAELGIPREFVFADCGCDPDRLKVCKDNYGYLVAGLQQHTTVGHFFNSDPSGEGTWAIDMWQRALENTPLSSTVRRNLMAWFESGATRQFSSPEEARRKLDTMSYETFLRDELQLGSEGARYADLFLASACGLGSDAVSAFAAYQLPMPGLFGSMPEGMRRVSFPGGNSGFVRYFLKRLIPDAIEGTYSFTDIITGALNLEALDRPNQPLRMRTSSTVLSVAHDGDPGKAGTVSVIYTQNGQFYGIKAKAVVMATGSWMNRFVVRDLPPEYQAACQQFVHAPFLVANVALNHWRFLDKLGMTAAIWNYDDQGFGYTCNIRDPMQVGDYQPPLDPNRPVVLSFYTPFFYPGQSARAQVTRGRAELLTTPYPVYEQKILRQMVRLFGAAGFNPKTDVAGIILNRWGHAYSVPYPGFYGGAGGTAPRDVLRKNHGRIAFGHSELDGLQHYGPAADEGRRAFNQIADAI